EQNRSAVQTQSSNANTANPAERNNTDRLDKVNVEIAELRTKVDTTNWMFTAVAAFLAVVLTIGTVTSLVGWIRSEKRATEAHSFALSSARDAELRTQTSFRLSIAGETASQNRAIEVHQTFLESSKD